MPGQCQEHVLPGRLLFTGRERIFSTAKDMPLTYDLLIPLPPPPPAAVSTSHHSSSFKSKSSSTVTSTSGHSSGSSSGAIAYRQQRPGPHFQQQQPLNLSQVNPDSTMP